MNTITKSVEMQVSAANGSENVVNGGVDEINASALTANKAVDWAWKKARARFNRQNNPAQAVKVRRCGFPDVVVYRDDTVEAAKDRMRAAWQRDTLSALAVVERGEDGQPLEHEVGPFAGGAGGSVLFALNFGGETATAEATTTPPEPMETPVVAEQGAVDHVGAQIEPDALGRVVKPSYLLGRNPALAEASAKVRSLGASETLVAAVSYAAMGWRVFPLAENAKVPEKGSNGFKDASTDTGRLVQWFDDGEFFQKGGNPRRNLGIATGETDAGYDLVVLDVDVKGGKNGFLVFGWAVGEFGELPATLAAATPSGGLHYLFKAPNGSNIGSRAGVFKQHGEGLDIRGGGGLIVAAPTTVNGKSYQWMNDLLPAWLPDSWITALQAECPVGGKRGAVSGSGIGDGERVTRGELSPMPEDVALAIAEHAVPSNVERTDWLKVLSVLSGFAGGEALARYWSGSGNYAKHFNDADFDKAWDEVHSGFNDGVPMGVGTLFNLVKEHSPEWQTPAARRKAEQEAKEQAAIEAARDAAGFGNVPDWMKGSLPREKVSMPVAAVSDEKAAAVLHEFIGKGGDVAKRVNDGEDVGHDVEHLFIAGMLTMNAPMVKYQVEHNPVPNDRSSKYHTKAGKVRAVIMHRDGSKPATAEDVNMDLFTPDYVGGTADAVTRLANRLTLDRDAALGNKPTDDERALVHRVLELSPLGQYWRENATEISKVRNGWSLKSAVDNGLSRATRYSTNTHAALSGSGNGLMVGALPDGKPGGKRSVEQVIVAMATDMQLGKLVAYDADYGLFYLKKGDTWKPQTNPHMIHRIVKGLADNSGLPHTARTIEGATKLMTMQMDSVAWCEHRHLVPMTNGVLDVNTLALLPYSDCQPFNWQLLCPYEPEATCHTWMEFLNTSLEGDSGAVSVVQAFLRCVFVGDSSAEKFLEVTGSGGTGKSTLMQVVKLLVGESNTASTSFKSLEENRFEPAALRGARLILIPDAKKYAGDMEMFKKLTGHDPLPYEPKNVQRQRGTDFVNEAPVIVTANGEIKSSETSSGILRRRLKIRFNRIVSNEEKARYGSAGIISVLKTELPGIVNWALSISGTDALATLRNPGDKLNALAEETARSNDPVLAWLTNNCMWCDSDEETPIGRLPQGGAVSMPAIGLYPHFVDYCEGQGIRYKPTTADFKQSIIDHCNRHKMKVEGIKVRSRRSPLYDKTIITNVRLRKPEDTQESGFFDSR